MPQLAEGIELLGEYEGSGFKEPPYLVRRADGQVLQLTRLLYLVAEEVDSKRDFGQIAERVTEKFGRAVSAENVEFLVEKKLRRLGVLASADGTSPKQLEKADPMLALNLRVGLVPERVVRAITTVFYPLFFPPVVITVLIAFVAFDVWFFFVHGVAQSVRDLTYQPVLFLMVLGLIVLSAAFHECGHATACRYGGAKPGPIGVGIYVVWPAFFSDVTDAYRLDKVGRVRIDLGGIYFNIIFSLLTAGAYFLTGFEPLLAVIVIQHLEMVHQLLPFLRLDGYYVVSDVTGVPDLFARIRPILRSLLPGKEPDESVTALKPWARRVVTAWVLAVVPILLWLAGVAAMSAPRLFATVYDSFFYYYDNVASAFSEGDAVEAAADSIQMVFLVLPLGGLTYTFGRVGKRLGVAAWKASEGNPTLRASFASIALVAIGFIAFLWWPNGDYRPIQPDERGTVQSSLSAVRDIPTGRPALPPEREAELNSAPTLREQQPGTGPSIEVPTESIEIPTEPTEVPTELKSEQQSSQRQEPQLEATQPGTQKDQQLPVAAEEKITVP